MKKYVVLTLALCLALFIAGCGASTAPVDDSVAMQDVVVEDVADVPAEDVEEEEIVEEITEKEVKEALLDELAESSETCIDSDGGLNYDEKGYVVDGSITEEDTCSKSRVYVGRLYEEYCQDGKHSRMTYDCPSGVCEDGACVGGSESTE